MPELDWIPGAASSRTSTGGCPPPTSHQEVSLLLLGGGVGGLTAPCEVHRSRFIPACALSGLYMSGFYYG